MGSRLKGFLNFADALLDRFQHVECLTRRPVEYLHPTVLSQFFANGFGDFLELFETHFQLTMSLFQLLTCTREDFLGPGKEHR